MVLTPRQKKNTMKGFQRHQNDTGSAEVQIAILTRKIDVLVSHLKKNPKDKHSRKGLLGMIARRRKLLAYLRDNNEKLYKSVLKKTGLKK
jgi:small subunit ribosomal protein S15